MGIQHITRAQKAHTTGGLVLKATPAGVVEAIISVYGIPDSDGDVIEMGAFAESIRKDREQFRVLDSHDARSTLSVIGKVLDIREIGKADLPADLLAEYPSATGGLWVKVQFMLDDQTSAAIFKRLQAGAVRAWSIGFSTIEAAAAKFPQPDGRLQAIRRILKATLYDASPVVWGAQPAARTISVKGLAPGDSRALARQIDAWLLDQEIAEFLTVKHTDRAALLAGIDEFTGGAPSRPAPPALEWPTPAGESARNHALNDHARVIGRLMRLGK